MGSEILERVALGLDVGTSSLKASIYSINKDTIIKNLNLKYEGQETDVGISKLKSYTDTIIKAINKVNEEYKVETIAFSTQMYSFIVELNGEKLVYQWNVYWKNDIEIEKIIEKYTDISGCPVDTLYPAYKILSAKKDIPSLNILPYGLQEAIVDELTGIRAGDYCCLSSYGFINVKDRTWNEELLSLAGWTKEDMPIMKRFNEQVGIITNPLVISDHPIKVACGLGDGPSASYASSDVSRIAANIGTSMAVRGFVKDISHIDFSKVWAYAVDEDTWVAGGISSNGSSVLDHYRNIDMLKDWELNPKIADDDVMYFPWNHGERTPFWSSSLKETMIGAGIQTTKNDYMCALFRGIAYTIARMYFEVNKVVDDIEVICIAGGGANSEILMRYLAGTLPVQLGILEDFDYLGSYGAAFAAAEAIDIKPTKNQTVVKLYNPTLKNKSNYEKWQKIADKMAKFYNELEV
jgi:gluconokinase